MKKLEQLSFGIGDRFGKEGRAQLRAIQEINRLGAPVVPVWNKSHREHQLVGSKPAHVAWEAEDAVKANAWEKAYYVDADHINLSNVEEFLMDSNFFTIDVANLIGTPPPEDLKEDFVARNVEDPVNHSLIKFIPEVTISSERLRLFADQYLTAIHEVKKIHDYILARRSGDTFITEVSMDEVEQSQSPLDLFLILKELKHIDVEPQTIAPKFSGLFPKGVDFVGDPDVFKTEFELDIRILQQAKEVLGLPDNLKLSVHSGSDKFSIYPAIRTCIAQYNTGVHIKTAGTTWLEEVAGLARGGLAGLAIAKHIYREAHHRYEELTAPYKAVLNIDPAYLPVARDVLSWRSDRFVKSLVHESTEALFNPHFRQLIHVAYRIAAEMGNEFTDALDHYRDPIEEQVYDNLLKRHLTHLFLS